MPLMIAAGLVLSGLGDMVPGVPPQFTAQTVQAAGSHKPITLDVAIDCRTWRSNGGVSFEKFGRGDSFLAEGRISFLPVRSAQEHRATTRTIPAASASGLNVGRWNTTLAEIAAGTRPAFYATWFFFLEDGSGLVVDGPHPESGPMAVVGGMGRFSGAGGQLVDQIIGSNISGCPNLRLTITLEKQAPK